MSIGEIIMIVIGVAVGGGVGYAVSIFTYRSKRMVDDLKSNLKRTNSDNELLKEERDELRTQNDILKDSVIQYQIKYDHLSQVVSDYEIYAKEMKKGLKLAQDLTDTLSIFDERLLEKLNDINSEHNENDNGYDDSDHGYDDQGGYDDEHPGYEDHDDSNKKRW